MVRIPPPLRRTDAGDDLRAIRALAVGIALLAAVALLLSWRAFDGRRAAAWRGSDAVGAALTQADGRTLVVDSLRGGGAAMRAGVQVGDLVEAVNGTPVASVAAADRALLGRPVDIRVRRGDREFDLHLDTTGGTPLG